MILIYQIGKEKYDKIRNMRKRGCVYMIGGKENWDNFFGGNFVKVNKF